MRRRGRGERRENSTAINFTSRNFFKKVREGRGSPPVRDGKEKGKLGGGGHAKKERKQDVRWEKRGGKKKTGYFAYPPVPLPEASPSLSPA